MPDAQRQVDVVRVRAGTRTADRDHAATEEPREIRLHGQPFAGIMRTPGADRELAAGVLLAERVLNAADDLGAIAHCTDPAAARVPEASSRSGRPDMSPPGAGAENIVDVMLAGGSAAFVDHVLADRRQVTTNSSCGLCGRRTIAPLAADAAPIVARWTVAADAIAAMPAGLRARQAVFDDTGGLHAAGLFARDGRLLDIAEDVGRHNAVDKIVGRMLMRDALPLSDYML